MSKEVKTKISEINVSCSAHATEDIEKVADAMLNVFPPSLRQDIEINIENLTGHAGNPIHLLEIAITKNKIIQTILSYLAEHLDESDKRYFSLEFDNRLGEDNCLYFRLNKQEAFKDHLTIENQDNAIRITIQFIIYKQDKKVIKELLENIGLIEKV